MKAAITVVVIVAILRGVVVTYNARPVENVPIIMLPTKQTIFPGKRYSI